MEEALLNFDDSFLERVMRLDSLGDDRIAGEEPVFRSMGRVTNASCSAWMT
jgi:hypothetical protein